MGQNDLRTLHDIMIMIHKINEYSIILNTFILFNEHFRALF